jgi:DNA-binding MarR family transcriptional regulator
LARSPDPLVVAALAQAFELVTRLAHARSHSDGLYPAQWAALRYFRTATGERRTAIALSRYQGLAFGPVARTVRTLVAHGWLRKAGSAGRGRSEAIELTREGEALLLRDPLAALVPALRKLSPGEQEALSVALENILKALGGSGPEAP